jgi:O-antigen ligase
MEYTLRRTNRNWPLIMLTMAVAVACAVAPQYALTAIGVTLALATGLVAVYFIARNPYWAFLTFAFTLPFATLKLIPGREASNPAYAALALLALSVIINLHRLPASNFRKIGVKPWLIGIFAGVGLLRAPFTLNQQVTLPYIVMAFVMLCVYLAAVLLIDTPRKLRTCLDCFLAGAVLNASAVLFYYFFVADPLSAFYRAGTYFAGGSSTGTVTFFVLAIPLALELAGRREQWLARLYYILVTMELVAVIILSATRSAWLALALLFLIELIRHPLRALGGAALIVLLITCAVRVYLPKTYEGLGARAFTAFNPEYGLPGETGFRIENYQVAANMLAAYPLMGVGLGNFAAHAGRFGRETVPLEFQLNAHNAYLEMLTGAGLIGGGAYLLVWLLTLWELSA